MTLSSNSGSSGSSGSSVPKGWRLQDIPNDELASLLKISRKEVAARRAMLVQQQADPAWIAATLEGLPAASLAVLHLVIEAGGLVMEEELLRAARERFGMSANDCRAASEPAISSVLMVPLRTRAGEIAFGVVLPAGALIAPLVVHVDLYELSAAAFVASASPTRNARMFLAACVASRHIDVKLTHEGRPHRGSLKRLAKQVGLDEASLEALLGTGLDLGMLHLEGELVRPDIEALAGAAVGRYPGFAALAALHAQLVGGPVATAAIVRSLQGRFEGEDRIFLVHDALTYLPGFEAGTVDGIPAVTRRAIEGVAGGHVTPSFEVFLPPESRLVDVVHVGACCEWERLDRVLVARITKPSIARAVTGGSSAGQILEQLAAASRHAIPQNVDAAIRDWAGSVVSATIAIGRVIVVDQGAPARVAPALAKLGPRELAPGVFVIGEHAELREIALALTRAGFYYREVLPVQVPPPRASEAEPPPAAPGASRVRARVAAWRRGEPFEGVRDDFLDKHRVTPSDPPAISTVGKPSELLERKPMARSRRSPPGLRWQRDDLRERLQQAARRSEALALQIANGVRYIEITQTMRRGSIWMVLGEDIANDDAVALRLDDVQAIAALPDDFDVDPGDDLAFDDDGDGPFDRKPWRPAHGQAAPPGHVPCPCGSGMRYRHCCRDIATT